MASSPLLSALLNKGKQASSAADNFLTSPGGGFLLNLLAQQGFSTMPQSPLGAIGKAGLASGQQQREDQSSDLQRRLIESQIGVNEFRSTQQGLNPSSGNVARTFEGQNGNMFIIRRSGEVEDTGIEFSNNLEFIEQADGSVRVFNRQTGEDLGSPVTPDQAASARTRELQTDKAFDLPVALQGLETQIGGMDRAVGKIEEILPLVTPANTGIPALRSGLPGGLGGDARTLDRALTSLRSNLGFDTLQRMRAASQTGGALGQVSERELDLLVNAMEAIDQEGSHEVLRENLLKVQEHYENFKREIRIMQDKLREQAGQPAQNQNRVVNFSDLPE